MAEVNRYLEDEILHAALTHLQSNEFAEAQSKLDELSVDGEAYCKRSCRNARGVCLWRLHGRLDEARDLFEVCILLVRGCVLHRIRGRHNVDLDRGSCWRTLIYSL